FLLKYSRSTASANGRWRRINSSRASEIARSRSPAVALARTSTIPHSMRRARSGAATRNAYPIPVVPGSIPRITDRLGVLQDLFRHVEVCVHLDDIVEVFERLDQTQKLLRLVAFDPNRGRGAHRELGGGHLDAGRVERLLHALERRRVAAADGALDRALDILARHVHVARAVHREAKAEITVGIAAAFLRGDHDLLGHLRENDAALDVRGAFLALDLTPL